MKCIVGGQGRGTRGLCLGVVMAVAAFFHGLSFAAENGSPAAPGAKSRITVKQVAVLDQDGNVMKTSSVTSFGGRIQVLLDGKAGDGVDLGKVSLYLDGHEFKGIYADVVDPDNNRLEFVIPDKLAAKDAWRPILRSPPFGGVREVLVSVGTDDGSWLPTNFKDRPRLRIALFSGTWWLLLAGIIAVGLALCRLAAKSNILRDSPPVPLGPGDLPPYSLAKTQAAIWFFLVFAAFMFIWFMTGNFYDVMTPTALALIGIGSGTTLGAAMVEATKSEAEQKQRQDWATELEAAEAELAKAGVQKSDYKDPVLEARISQLKRAIRPVSRSLHMDLLTDGNGIALHRFQMLVWTLAMALIFLADVYGNLVMPVFDSTLLALMGISSGVYLGFKIPEKQA
jgi:anti-sigma28 factor (negative regulator of flagellin synthesis)